MVTLDPTSTAAIGTAAAGLTQILKDLGLQGEWNKLACVVIAVTLGCIYMFDPALWTILVPILIGTTGTGGFSMIQDIAKTFGQSPSRL